MSDHDKLKSTDPDILASLAALRRAARVARKRSIESGTGFYIWRDGKVVDLNAERRKRSGK